MNTPLEIPSRMRKLPLDKHGRPVPWFVAWIEGEPDFRVIREDGIRLALRFRHCWLCGQPLGKFVSFVIGPMCALNRVSAEPGSHGACARYAAQACPFLATPGMKRRDRSVPEHAEPAGIACLRNPGVALVWTSTTWRPFPAPGGILIDVGAPVETEWFAEGRPATRAEVLASIESGLPVLQAEAQRDTDPAAALAQLSWQRERALSLLPADEAGG